MSQQKKNPYATPAQPTRERALYITAAHGYADAFRCTFVDPVTARRRFRRAAEWDEGGALAALLLHPDDYGPRCVRRFASAVRDPAFIYWTMRERRPRVFLMRIVDLLHGEAGRRAHTKRIEETRKSAEDNGSRAGAWVRERERDRGIAAQTIKDAARVYARPARACRVILRVVRRHGAQRARALLNAKPDFFGALRIVKHPRGVWPLLLVFDSTEEAKRAVPGFLNSFDNAVSMRRLRRKTGSVQRVEWLASSYRTELQQLVQTEPPSGALAEAGRLVAILCRRRDVDEAPKGKGPPPIYKQLAAMLPERMHGLIVEALKLAKDETGESPQWDRGRDGYGKELERSLSALEPEVVPQPRPAPLAWEQGRERSRDRGRERGRGGGMEL
jgi:hypothetical protein